VLQGQQQLSTTRNKYYNKQLETLMNPQETAAADSLKSGKTQQTHATVHAAAATVLHLIPVTGVGISGFGGTPAGKVLVGWTQRRLLCRGTGGLHERPVLTEHVRQLPQRGAGPTPA